MNDTIQRLEAMIDDLERELSRVGEGYSERTVAVCKAVEAAAHSSPLSFDMAISDIARLGKERDLYQGRAIDAEEKLSRLEALIVPWANGGLQQKNCGYKVKTILDSNPRP